MSYDPKQIRAVKVPVAANMTASGLSMSTSSSFILDPADFSTSGGSILFEAYGSCSASGDIATVTVSNMTDSTTLGSFTIAGNVTTHSSVSIILPSSPKTCVVKLQLTTGGVLDSCTLIQCTLKPQ